MIREAVKDLERERKKRDGFKSGDLSRSSALISRFSVLFIVFPGVSKMYFFVGGDILKLFF